MKVKELIEHLKKMPQNADCIYAIDEEGNGYEKVFYSPTLGKFKQCGRGSRNGYFCDNENLTDDMKDGETTVCIN